MNAETKLCQNCKKDFTIEPEDFNFYERIKVPPPTFCPECRMQRRLAFRNDLVFYNRNCDMCGNNIISLYNKEKQFTVYCNKCWWSDKWDPKSYGIDFDFSRPFFDQFNDFQSKVPIPALVNDNDVGSINCEYTHNVTFAKNCYMGSMSWKNEDCMYYYHVAGPETRDVIDSNDIFNYSQIIYDSIFLEHCYNCRNCYYSTGLTNCFLCYDCKGCTDCFMCVNLRQKSNCILNKQYSKEEYQQIIKDYRLDTYSGNERAKKELSNFLLREFHRYANLRNCINSTGDALFNCKNSKHSFFARACEDIKFFTRGNEVKDSYDLSTGGESSQCYESLTADNDYRALFSIFSFKNQEVSYVINCHSSKYLFGCSGIKHGKYSIFNKEYEKDEYLKLRDKIIDHMKIGGEYGEFFPVSLSPFGYNETIAQEYFPLNEKEAKEKGYKWWNKLQKTTDKETIRTEEIPDSILDIEENVLNQILCCVECKRNYKIVQNEFIIYKKYSIPIPRKCFYCRNSSRLKFENPLKLWHRKCMKDGCSKEFETSYSPDRPEIVYCEKCYQQEVY